VQAGAEASRGDLVVALGRRGNDRGVGDADDFLEMRKRLRAVGFRHRVGARGVGIDHGDQLGALAAGEFLGVQPAHVAGADDGNLQ